MASLAASDKLAISYYIASCNEAMQKKKHYYGAQLSTILASFPGLIWGLGMRLAQFVLYKALISFVAPFLL